MLRQIRADPRTDLAGLGLTDRQNEVLFWLIEGKGNADIAAILGMAQATVSRAGTVGQATWSGGSYLHPIPRGPPL